MKLKRKILNIFAAVVMVFGSMPISFTNTFAADDEPTGIVPEEENIPKSLKKVHANNDGTYDITLEIEGVSKQKNDATKANVVVVFDSSGSMDTPSIMTVNATGRYGIVNGDYSNLYRESGWSCVRITDNTTSTAYSDNNCNNRYSGTRYAGSGSTRLQVAKDAISDLAEQLLSQNDSSTPGLEDVVEMAFIDFSTDIKDNTTNTTPTTDLATFQGWVNSTSADGGTNWEAALRAADNVSFGENDNDKTYIIFVSDGNPTFRISQDGAGYRDTDGCRSEYQTYGGGCTVWGSGYSDPEPHRNFRMAKAAAQAIVDNDNKELDNVGAFGNVDNMVNLGGNYHDASDQDALEEAFAEIVDKIKMGLSVADLQIEDGITPATSTEVDGTAGNFRYSVPDSWGDDWGKASFEGGSVHWNPGEHKTLSNGEKASVTFTVWPSQEAMDCIAAIRNDGTCDESDLTKFGLGVNSDGSFRLITNNTATFRFKTATKNEDTGETTYSDISIPIDFDEERDPTNLPETTLDVVKVWLDSMDARQRDDISDVTVDLFVDREDNPDQERHYTFTKGDGSGNEWVGEDENGKSEYTVAPGVMKKLDGTPETEGLRGLGPVVKVGNDEYVVLETGHDYEFDNEQLSLTEDGSNHYHITKRKYHPMIIGEGGNIHDVVFSDDGKTATIEDGVLTKLSLENTLNGGILVGKTVINNDKEDKTIEDEYDITITLSEDTGVYRIYTYNPDGTEKERSEKKTYTGGVINEKITVNQKIRVQDVPTGTTYEVTEVLPNGYTRNKVDYTVVMYDGTDDKDGVQEVFGNASAQATVTNYLESGDLIIKKTVTASSGDLEQAQNQEFSFTVNFYKSQDKTELMRTDTETCKAVKHNETCEIKNIPKGWYYEIVEAAKTGFNGGAETTKTGTIVKGDNKAEFTNDYAVTPVDAEIIAHKAFAQGYRQFWIDSDSFELQLIGDNEIIDSQNATLSGSEVKFKRKYTNPGTYNYVITEKTQNADGSSAFRQGVHRVADDADIEVTVVVEDNGEGALVIKSITYKKTDQTIYNIYEDTKTYGANKELEFTKVLEGRDWRSTDEFKFKITGSDGAPMPATKEFTIKNSTTDHKASFGTIKFSEQDAGNTYVYTVSEEFDVPSVEAKDGKDSVTFTVEVVFDEEEGTLNLVVSDYENTFTNVYKTVNLTATKVWDDDEDRDGLRKNYKDFFVAVKNDEGKYVAYEALSLEDKDDYSFSNLPEKNAEGEAIEYTIVEASTCSGSGESIRCTEFKKDDDYIATVENNVITNFHEPELYDTTGDLTVKKIWAGEGFTLPGSVSVELLANGEVIRRANIVAGQNNEWTYTFSDLYMNDGGEPITYSVQESAIGETAFGENESVIVILTDEGAIAGSWTKSVDNEKYEITNTWKESSDEIIYEGAKKFNIKKVDENYKPMAGVTFAVEGADDRQTDANGMTSKSVPVSKTEKEDSFEFVVSEKETLDGYDLVEGSATVAVSCTSELTGKDFNTLVNTYTKTCEFTKSGSDKYVWNAEDLTLTVVNKRSLAKSLTIKKTVKGLSAEVLTDLEFTIKGPEDFGENSTMTLKVSEDCTITNDVITCRVEGKVPTGKYTVTESNADVKHFELIVSGDNDVEKKVTKDEHAVFEITNEYEVEKTMYYVDKIWEDAHDKDGKRPEKLTIKLLANGEIIETVDLTMKDAYIIGEEDEGDYETGDIWSYVWEELPYADEKAEVISYTAEEVLESDDYEQLADYSDEYRTTFVNYHEPEDDPCAAGGCGGDIIPPMAPETGKFTGKRGGGKDATVENSLVMGGAIVMAMFIGMPMLAVAASRRKK